MIAKPEMIFFDYGNTLCAEPFPFDGALGFSRVLEHAVNNPKNATGEQLLTLHNAIAAEAVKVNELNIEVNHRETLHAIFDRMGIVLDISDLQTEDIFWNSSFPALAAKGANEAMELLARLNIRTAVVSNMSFSGEALKLRIDRHLPANRFEFIAASSDYFYRKPREEFFLAALGKAGVEPKNCVFCGDSVECDIMPSAKLGMQPVWMPEHSESKDRRAEAQRAGALIFESWRQFSDYAGENWSNRA